MSDKSGGFFMSVGRFFTGNKSDRDSQSSAQSSPASPSSSTSPRKPGSTFLKDIMSIDSKIDASSKKHGSNLRFLSPSVLESGGRKKDKSMLEIDVDPVMDIFSSPSVSLTRKRQLTETDKSLLTQTFRSESVKRSRCLGNRSLLEPNLKALASPKLDTTWCGQFSASHSPNSSVTGYSLLSRRSGNVSNGSNLSSSTQQFLRKLEQANTPAKDVQRMTTLRAGLSRPERWATSNSSFSSDAPPLRKAGDNIPSRIQLLSKSMAYGSQKKPYWRDLTRKRSDPKFSDATTLSTISAKTNGSMHSTELSSLFSLNDKDEGSKKSDSSVKKHQSTLKGSDGKAVGKNTFKLLDDVDEDVSPISEIWKSNAKQPTLNTENAPQSGFLGKLSFSFAPPTELVPLTTSAVTSENESDNNEDEDDDDVESIDNNKEDESKNDSSSKESSEESDDSESSDSDDDEAEKSVKKSFAPKQVDSRPQTSTDTVSPAVSIDSSKNNSPKVSLADSAATSSKTETKAQNWTCDGCFTSWPASSNECGCCGTAKGGAAATSAPPQKSLVSNLSSFGSSKPSGVSFGFSSAPAPAPSVSNTSVDSLGAPAATKPLFGTGIASSIAISKPSESAAPAVASEPKIAFSAVPAPVAPVAPVVPVVAPAPAASSSSTSADRVAWDCPDCMVNNKSTDDKCVCCGYVKYKSAESSSNVFGALAFKPNPSAGSLFGTGSSSVAPKFGFGVSTEKKAENTEATKPAAAPFSFGIPAPTTTESAKSTSTTSTTSGQLFGTSKPAEDEAKKSTLPAFGTGSTLFGVSKPETTAPASEPTKPSMFGIPTVSTSEKKDTPLFGSSLSANSLQVPVASTASALPAPTFGSGSIFGMTGVTPTIKETTPSAPVAAPALTFGQPSAELPKTTGSLFGNLTSGSNTLAPSTSAVGSLSTTSLFGAGSSSNSLFGNVTVQSMFGSDSTDGAGPAKKSMFASSSDAKAPVLSFGGMDKTAAPVTTNTASAPFVFGASSASKPAQPSTIPFGSSTGSSFGGFGSSTSSQLGNNTLTVPAFGAPSAAPAFGSSNTLPAFGSFGGAQKIPPLQPTISNSSSTSSLFNLNAPAPAADVSNPFQAGPSNGFNFGGSTAPNPDGVFKFGSSNPPPAPTAPNGQSFQFTSGPTPGGSDMFGYQPNANSIGGRKMAMARRRNIRK